MPRQPKLYEESRFLGLSVSTWAILGIGLFPALLGAMHGVVNLLLSQTKPETTPGVVARSGPLSGKQQGHIAVARAEARVKRDVSQSSELSDLYHELLDFKEDPEFHKHGFAPGSRWRGWLERVNALRKASKGLSPQDPAPGCLVQLGLKYVFTRGSDTSYTLWLREQIKAGLPGQ